MDASDHPPIDSLLQHDSWLRALASHLASDRSEAEDLAQETWLAALQHPPKNRAGDVRGWLSRVARNRKLQRSRAGGRRARREAIAGEHHKERGVPTPEEIESAIELRQLLLDELAQLDEPLRIVIAMRYLDGLSFVELAARAQLPVETAKSRAKRGLQQMRERLDRHNGGRAHWVALCHPWRDFNSPAIPASTMPPFQALLMTTTTKASWTAALLLAAVSVGYLMSDAGSPENAGLQAPVNSEATGVRDLPSARALANNRPDTTPNRRQVAAESLTKSAESPLVPGPGEVIGRVIDVQGNPVAGIDVRSTAKESPVARTDGFGSFAWTLEEEPQLLTTSGTAWVCVSRGGAMSDIASPLILVVAEPATYAGIVRDEAGNSLAGVKLMLQLEKTWSRHLTMDLSAGNQQRWHAQSDENGVFRMGRVPALPEATLWLQRDGRTGLYQAPGESKEDLQLVLRMTQLSKEERWATIPHMAGRVVSATGEPLADVQVRARTYAAETEPDGSFRLPYSVLDESSALRLIRKGVLPMEVLAPGLVADDHHGWPEFMQLRMDSPPLPSIRGRVVTVQNEPAAGCVVFLTNLTPLDSSPYPDYLEDCLGQVQSTTEADGAFSLTVLPGERYVVSAFDRAGWRTVRSGPVLAGDHELVLTLPDPPGHGDVRGRCVDTGGNPVAGVTVGPRWSILSGGDSTEFGDSSARTDAEGYFLIRDQQLGFNSFHCEGSRIIPQLVSVDPFHQGTFQLTVKRRARIHVSAKVEAQHWPNFMIYDEHESAAELYLFQRIANGNIEGADITSWGELTEGVSPTYSLAEGSYELRLMDGESKVLRRVPVELTAGETLELMIE